jgi:DnaJ-domain-containing protein 1
VGSPIAGRNRPETEPLIGYFVNTLVLRDDLSGDPTFRESLRRTRETALGAFTNQDLPFEKLVEDLNPARTTAYNPLFQVWFVMQQAFAGRQELNGLDVQYLDSGTTLTRHDLQLSLWESAKGLEGAFTYSTALFDGETIDCMAEQFKSLLSVIVEQPETRLSALRVSVNETGRAYRAQAIAGLEETSRLKLKSAKRKVASNAFIKERLLNPERSLPLLIEPATHGVSLPDWAMNSREFIRQRLQRHGAILFRGFNLNSVDEFELLLRSLTGELLEYSYRSTPRTQVSGRIYTSTEYPAHQTIPLHNEMSYTRNWPMIIGFFCVEVAPEGGETPIADSRRVFDLIDPAVRDRFARKKVMYVRNYGEALDLS